MIGWTEAPRTWPLADAMARKAGLDLPRAVLDGWLRRDELGRIVGRCTACGATDDCAGWIRAGQAAVPPGFCANKAEIEALSI